MPTFAERLDQVVASRDSLLCVGLDPDPDLMPIDDVERFLRDIVDATADVVSAFKLQVAFYEALGLPGMRAMDATIRYIRDRARDVLVIGDAKRGDIGSTASAYARAMFETWAFDAATVNVYQGRDAISPFLSYTDKGTFVVCRTSNPSSRDFQDRWLADPGGTRLFEHVADEAAQWNVAGNIGLVVGATYPQDIQALRARQPSLPFLVPGIGVQGGVVSIAPAAISSSGGGALLSASRSVLYASSGSDYAVAARDEAERLAGGIRAALRTGMVTTL